MLNNILRDRPDLSELKGPTTSFVLGTVIVIFFTLLGAGIDRTTELVDLYTPLVTIVRAASLGLGTGYYLGASLGSNENNKQWLLLGIFTSLTIGALFTMETRIFEWLPASTLIPIGVVLSILAHFSPAVQNDRTYKYMFQFLTGYMTTFVVVILSAAEYIFTILGPFDSAAIVIEIGSNTINITVGMIILALVILIIYRLSTSNL